MATENVTQIDTTERAESVQKREREDLMECVEFTLADAEDANLSVGALLELLRGCPADYPLSAGLFLGLVNSIKSHLSNVVDGLRVVNRVGLIAGNLIDTGTKTV